MIALPTLLLDRPAPKLNARSRHTREKVPAVAEPQYAGTVNGKEVTATSFRFVGHRLGRTADGNEQRCLTQRHRTAPLDVEECTTAWGETGVLTRVVSFTNRGRAAITVALSPAWVLPAGDYTLRYLYGAWGQERQLGVESLGAGVRRFAQRSGRSSRGYVAWLWERWQVVTGAALARDGLVVALDEEWRAVVIELVPR